MKKLFTSFVAAGTVASFASCHKKKTDAKPADTKDTKTEAKATEVKTTTVKKGTVMKGTFKVGYVGHDIGYAYTLRDTITQYTQDVTEKSSTGTEYFNLPSGLFLQSSVKYNESILSDSGIGTIEIDRIREMIKKYLPLTASNQAGTQFEVDTLDGVTLPEYIDAADEIGEVHGMIYTNTGIHATKPQFDAMFTPEKLKKIYQNLKHPFPTAKELYEAFEAAEIRLAMPDANTYGKRYKLRPNGFNKDLKNSQHGHWWISNSRQTTGSASDPVVVFNSAKDHERLPESWFPVKTKDTYDAKKTQEALSDKTKLASKNLDALFVHVTDGKENSSEVYKNVVEKKEFKNTKLFFVGDKAKAQDGASSKVFAGGNVSTATFSEYAAAYIAGFQSAVGAIRYSSSEDVYEETNVVFLIGSTSESKDKKKAFAFRRGVEAAAAHSAYSKYLKVKFVSKTADSSKSSKKLYREISEWTAIDDSKTKLYEFSSSDTFSDADRRIVYIAGAKAKDWTGMASEKVVETGSGSNKVQRIQWDNQWNNGDKTGLIGALYNYKKVTTDDTSDSTLSSKTFGASGVWIIVDKAYKTDSKKILDAKANSLFGSTYNTSDDFERRQVKFMGFVGEKQQGTKNYVKFAMKGYFMGGANYMVGKHTVFGAPLETVFGTPAKAEDFGTSNSDSSMVRKTPWAFHKTSSGKDTAGKNYDRFNKSLEHAWSMEVTDAELTKSSPWLK